MSRKLNEGSNIFKNTNINVSKWVKAPTGFKRLDEALNGGFSAGLHCIGAISSLGKSTFVTQMAENFAKKKPVIIFSLEMDTENLGAKSVSRQLFKNNSRNSNLTKSPDDLMNPTAIKKFSKEEWCAINKAAEEVEKINDNIEIVECEINPCTADWIVDYINTWVKTNSKDPIVIIDYLQILAPMLPFGSDKQNADKSLEALKRLSKSINTPVIIISSFNRDSYDTEVSIKSFKDSGNIEYSSDTLIGMQYTGVGKQKFNIKSACAENPRKIEVVILKQRNGKSGITLPYKYYPENCYFEEAKEVVDNFDINYDIPCV